MQKYLRARRLRHFQLKRALLRMLQKIQVRFVQQECEQIRTLSCRIVILNMKRTLRLWREVLIASEEVIILVNIALKMKPLLISDLVCEYRSVYNNTCTSNSVAQGKVFLFSGTRLVLK